MKKQIVIIASAAMAMAVSFTSCGNKPAEAELNNASDSLSYCAGVSNTEGMRQALEANFGVDSVYLDEVVAGVREYMDMRDDEKARARNLGKWLGVQYEKGLFPQMNRNFYPDQQDSINVELFLAGLHDALLCGDDSKIGLIEAQMFIREMSDKAAYDKKIAQYGDIKVAGEAFIDSISKVEGIQSLQVGDDVLYYRVNKVGKGAVPTEENRVKVHYKGTLIDGTVFDSSYDRKEPTVFGVTQVIKGWTEILKTMPVGSNYTVYLPYQLAYGANGGGSKIKPFSALVFDMELIGIEK